MNADTLAARLARYADFFADHPCPNQPLIADLRAAAAALAEREGDRDGPAVANLWNVARSVECNAEGFRQFSTYAAGVLAALRTPEPAERENHQKVCRALLDARRMLDAADPNQLRAIQAINRGLTVLAEIIRIPEPPYPLGPTFKDFDPGA